jgi:hypothetical protein
MIAACSPEATKPTTPQSRQQGNDLGRQLPQDGRFQGDGAAEIWHGVSVNDCPRVQLPCTPVVADSLGESRGWSGGWARLFHFNHVGYPQDTSRNARITLTRMFATLAIYRRHVVA